MRYSIIYLLLLVAIIFSCKQEHQEANTFDVPDSLKNTFRDHTLPIEKRIDDLIGKLTLEEKIGFLMHDNPAVDRLGIKPYSWWGEAGHGVSRNGKASVFPQSIGLAATFDKELLTKVATVISNEARAKYNIAQEMENYGAYAGLSFWAPNINLFRDPRWGRGQETYGEDPFLTGQMAIAYATGMQGDHPRYLKTAICAKHYAVHSGPEDGRKKFNAEPPIKDLYETYLPAFKTMITEGNAEIVMCAYSLLYGKPCCGSGFLLTEILKEDWGFDGHIVTDCSAIGGFHTEAKVTDTPEESAAMAIKNGIDMNCGGMFKYLPGAIEQGLIKESIIDERLRNVLKSRFKLGLFDSPGLNPYDTLAAKHVNTNEARNLAREAAAKTVVLAKNKNNVLPLDKNAREYYLVGPSAANLDVLLGTYYGTNNDMKTLLEGINEKISLGTTLEYKYGFLPDQESVSPLHWWHMTQMNTADAILVCAGLSGQMEGEEGETILTPNNGDRSDIMLPQSQINFIKRVSEYGDKPIVLIITGGSPVALGELEDIVDAVLYVFYPGEEGGTGVADVLFGDVSPAGRFPFTVPKSVDQLPDFKNYSMEGRTYKYMTKEPLFPFGYGLSYTQFEYSDIKLDKQVLKQGEKVEVSVYVKNTGGISGDEVIQLYISSPRTDFRVPLYDLKGFERFHLEAEESKTIKFQLNTDDFMNINEEGEKVLVPGEYIIYTGGSLPSQRSIELGASQYLEKRIKIEMSF